MTKLIRNCSYFVAQWVETADTAAIVLMKHSSTILLFLLWFFFNQTIYKVQWDHWGKHIHKLYCKVIFIKYTCSSDAVSSSILHDIVHSVKKIKFYLKTGRSIDLELQRTWDSRPVPKGSLDSFPGNENTDIVLLK